LVISTKNDNEDYSTEQIETINKEPFLNSIDNVSLSYIRTTIQESAIIVINSAAAVGSSVALIFIPNLETITFFIFLTAFVYGYRIGFMMMFTTSITFEFFASAFYGVATYLLPFKILSYTITVITAASIGKVYLKKEKFKDVDKKSSNKSNSIRIKIIFAFVGAVLTLFFDIITTFSLFLFSSTFEASTVLFITGIPWYLFHQITNALLFTLIPTIGIYLAHSNFFMYKSISTSKYE
jgi:hypothetical protein